MIDGGSISPCEMAAERTRRLERLENDGDIIDLRAAAECTRRLGQQREALVNEVSYMADSFAIAAVQGGGVALWQRGGGAVAEAVFETAVRYVEARRRLEAAYRAGLEAADEQEVEGFDGDIPADAVEVTPPGAAPLADA